MSTETDPTLPDPLDVAATSGVDDPYIPYIAGGDDPLTQDDGYNGDLEGEQTTTPLDPDGWLTLDDGTRLQLVDNDGDGVADVTVQVFADGWIIGRDVDGDDPRFEWYDAEGNYQGIVDENGQLLQQSEQTDLGETQPDESTLTYVIDGTTYSGTADLDLNRDGVPESFSITDEAGRVVVMTDTDGDGVADRAYVETEQGGIVLHFDGVNWIADESSYVPEDDGTDQGNTDGSQTTDVTVPEQFRQEVDPNAPLQVQIMQRAMDNYGLAVAALWSQAYPGEPWPLDDDGNPYHPNVLARVIANDDSLDPSVQRMGTDFVEHWDTISRQAVGSEQAGAIMSSAAQSAAEGAGQSSVMLADGTVLQLNDADLDGSADVLIRTYPDRYVVISGADSPTPLTLTFGLDGTLLDTNIGGDDSDEDVIVEERQDLQTVDPMDNEVIEDSAFWFAQEGPTCALASLTQVVQDFLGTDVDVDDVEAYAIAMGWYTDGQGVAGDGGTDFYRVDDILTHFGVPSQVMTLDSTSAMDQIDAWTEQGTAVIAWIDASQYWSEDLWPESNGEASHAVRVLDVDEERGVVIINDTGIPGGRALEIPIDAFSQAMAYSNYTVVTSLGTDPDGVGATAGAGPLAENGFVLLPVKVVLNPAWAAYLAGLVEA